MKKYSREDQRLLAAWAADCAGRVLPLFEAACPEDDRPRRAIETCRAWVDTGIFRMAVIRGASLAAHATARDAKEHPAAGFAARAAGHAVATAHVAQHAFGSAYYALKAVAAASNGDAAARVMDERNWQSLHLPEHLREEFLRHVIFGEHKRGIRIQVLKSKDF